MREINQSVVVETHADMSQSAAWEYGRFSGIIHCPNSPSAREWQYYDGGLSESMWHAIAAEIHAAARDGGDDIPDVDEHGLRLSMWREDICPEITAIARGLISTAVETGNIATYNCQSHDLALAIEEQLEIISDGFIESANIDTGCDTLAGERSRFDGRIEVSSEDGWEVHLQYHYFE